MTYGVLNVDTVQSSTAATAPVFKDGNGTQIGTLCRAWVNFNGTSGASPVVRSSFNVSSVVRNTTGQYSINFTNALPDANYAISIGANNNASNVSSANNIYAYLTTGFTWQHIENNALADSALFSASVFR